MKRDPSEPPQAPGVPIIALRRPRCPTCKAINKTPLRSKRDGETIIQRRKCGECGQIFITVCD